MITLAASRDHAWPVSPRTAWHTPHRLRQRSLALHRRCSSPPAPPPTTLASPLLPRFGPPGPMVHVLRLPQRPTCAGPGVRPLGGLFRYSESSNHRWHSTLFIGRQGDPRAQTASGPCLGPKLAAWSRGRPSPARPAVHVGCAVRSGASHSAAGPCPNADPLRRTSRSMRAAL